MKNEKGKNRRLPGGATPGRITNYELRIARGVACFPLTLIPLTLSPATEVHRRSSENTIQSRRDAYHFVAAQFNDLTIQQFNFSRPLIRPVGMKKEGGKGRRLPSGSAPAEPYRGARRPLTNSPRNRRLDTSRLCRDYSATGTGMTNCPAGWHASP